MRRYHIVSRILLILSIVDFAVTAPVLGQEKLQARVDVVHIPKHAMTMFGKRGGEWDKILFEIFGDTEDHSVRPDSPEDFEKPESSSATRPSSSSQPSGLAGGSMAVEHPLPSIHEEPLPVSGQDDILPNQGNTLNDLWLKIHRHSGDYLFPKPGGSSATRPSSSSQLSGLAHGWAHGWTDVMPLILTPIHEEPVPASSQVHAQPGPGSLLNEEWNKMWRDFTEGHFPEKPEESSAVRPSSSSLESGPVDAWAGVKHPVPSIPEESSPVSSPVHALPSPGLEPLTESGYKLMEGDVPHWPSGLASSKMSSADHGLMGAHALPNPGLSTESGHEMMDVPQQIPVSSKKHDLQPMGAESPDK